MRGAGPPRSCRSARSGTATGRNMFAPQWCCTTRWPTPIDCVALGARLFIVGHCASTCSRQLIRQQLRVREPPSRALVLMPVRTRMTADETYVEHHILTLFLNMLEWHVVTEQHPKSAISVLWLQERWGSKNVLDTERT